MIKIKKVDSSVFFKNTDKNAQDIIKEPGMIKILLALSKK